MTALECPSCGGNNAREQLLGANHDRGAIRVFVCCLCGEQIGPGRPVMTDLVAFPLPRIAPLAGRLSRVLGPSVHRFAPLGAR